MSPTVRRIEGYRFFFNSREETRRHIHVATTEGIAKFWLEPIITLSSYHNLSQKELRRIETLVREYQDEFTKAWDAHFGQ